MTLFNRGKSNPDLFPNCEHIIGDRDGGLGVLQDHRWEWDAVIDTCGYLPRQVHAAASALAHRVNRYIFISSISAYADFSQMGIDEQSPTAVLEDETVETVTNETYGGLKAACEQAAEQAMEGRVLVIRPGLIVGPHDAIDRFTYWPYRVAQGGEMLAPGDAGQQTQFVDVRDLAAWTIHMVEEQKTGIYNATGPDYTLSMGQFLEACRQVTGSDTRFTWVKEDFLTSHDVDLPNWVPDAYKGLLAVNCQKAFQDGLRFRPLAQTIRDTLAWKRADGSAMRVGLTPEQEQTLLEAWHKKS